MTEPRGGAEDLFGGPQRALIALIVVILVSGIAIGGIAFVVFGGRGGPPTTQATAPLPSAPVQTATATVTETSTASPPRVTGAPSVSATMTPAAPPRPSGYPSQAMIVGTCDEGGSCGVKQRTAPNSDAPRLYPNDLQDGAVVTAVCQTVGDARSSQGAGSSKVWYRLNNAAYVNAVYMTAMSSWVPMC